MGPGVISWRWETRKHWRQPGQQLGPPRICQGRSGESDLRRLWGERGPCAVPEERDDLRVISQLRWRTLGVSQMRVTVVYESLFGNTRTLAEAIAEGIRAAVPGADVSCIPVAEAGPAAAEADLLVAGGPTHFLGMTSQRSRRMARQYWAQATGGAGRTAGDAPPAGPGVREWLATLPAGGGHLAAAFDTRLDTLFPGSAARLIGRILRDQGYQIIAAPEGFTVTAMQGPLSPGEQERAKAWGAELADSLRQPGPAPSRRPSRLRPGRTRIA